MAEQFPQLSREEKIRLNWMVLKLIFLTGTFYLSRLEGER